MSPDVIADAGPVLARWAGQPSGSHDLPGLAAMAALIRERAARLPGTLEDIPLDGGAAALRMVVRPEAPRRVVLVGHYDTVHGPDLPGPPVALGADGVITGPGVADMKGGILVMIAALAGFEAASHAGALGWELLITPDEELGAPHSLPLLHAAAAAADAGLVFEPAAGAGDVVVGRRGRSVLRVEVAGRAAHAGRNPAEGRNAVTALAEMVLAAEALAAPGDGTDVTVGIIRGGAAVNVVPDAAVAEVDVRVTAGTALPEARAGLERACSRIAARRDVRATVTEVVGCPAMPVTPGAARLADLYIEEARARHLAPAAVSVGGVSDANHLAGAGLAVIDGLGVVGGGLHGPDEWADTGSVAARAAVAAALLGRLATGAHW
ncbi:MAG: M20/M25/M40 family metallo-hydrolase [Thermoleophilia bacterium]|nr:M20/M25/M40 family metallo-hydrolase [Thermoleophilia bacterium]